MTDNCTRCGGEGYVDTSDALPPHVAICPRCHGTGDRTNRRTR